MYRYGLVMKSINGDNDDLSWSFVLLILYMYISYLPVSQMELLILRISTIHFRF